MHELYSAIGMNFANKISERIALRQLYFCFYYFLIRTLYLNVNICRLQSDGTTLKVQAKAFQSKSDKGAIDYQLTDSSGYISSVFSINSDGEIEALQSLDYENSPQTYTLKIVGTEKSTWLSSASQVSCFVWVSRF